MKLKKVKSEKFTVQGMGMPWHGMVMGAISRSKMRCKKTKNRISGNEYKNSHSVTVCFSMSHRIHLGDIWFFMLFVFHWATSMCYIPFD